MTRKPSNKARGNSFMNLVRAAQYLNQLARTYKSSYSVRGRWPNSNDKAEYDELRDLARKLRAMAKEFA